MLRVYLSRFMLSSLNGVFFTAFAGGRSSVANSQAVKIGPCSIHWRFLMSNLQLNADKS